MAIQWTLLMEWLIVAVVIAAVVSVVHSFYSSSGRKDRKIVSGTVPMGESTGYFIQVSDASVDNLIRYAEEILRDGKLNECVENAYLASEKLLVQAAVKVGADSSHISLFELGEKLAKAGLMRMETKELLILDTAKTYSDRPINLSTASRVLGAALYIQHYFAHAPVDLVGKRPIGETQPSST